VSHTILIIIVICDCEIIIKNLPFYLKFISLFYLIVITLYVRQLNPIGSYKLSNQEINNY